jgi:pyrimidine operon attenuation protein/uracil phosphoribosyltransferase
VEGRGGDRDIEEQEAFPHLQYQPPKQPPDVRARVHVCVDDVRLLGRGVRERGGVRRAGRRVADLFVL